MSILLVILELSFFYFVAEDPGVLDEEVLLHPGDQSQRFQNIKIRILLEKLAYKHVYCPRVPFQCRFRGGGISAPPPALNKVQDNLP